MSTPVPTTATTTRLPRDQSLALRQRQDHQVECLAGSLWITQDGDPRDILLAAGECFTLDRRGVALVTAMHDARLRLNAPARAARLRWLRALLAPAEPSTAAPSGCAPGPARARNEPVAAVA